MTSLSPRPFAAMLAAVATLALVLSACAEEDCTLIGCANEPVALILLGPNWMPLKPAVYELGFELDGVGYTTTCSALETNQSCEPTQGSAPDFEVSVFVTTNNQIRINVTAGDTTQLPDDFHVEVSVGGSPVVEESGVFEYNESQPNGPGCGSTCRSSDGAFVFVEL